MMNNRLILKQPLKFTATLVDEHGNSVIMIFDGWNQTDRLLFKVLKVKMVKRNKGKSLCQWYFHIHNN